jgi:hypothetical protein
MAKSKTEKIIELFEALPLNEKTNIHYKLREMLSEAIENEKTTHEDKVKELSELKQKL